MAQYRSVRLDENDKIPVEVLPTAPEAVGAEPAGLSDETRTSLDAAYATKAEAGAAPAAKLDAAVGYTGTMRGAWAGSIAYAVGDVVTVEAGVFRTVTAHTSNGAGFRYDREKWEALPVPALSAGTVVPVRRVDLTSQGSGLTVTPPKVGVFQHRPKQFSFAGERTLWAFDDVTDFTLSGSIGTASTGTQIGGSVVLTAHTTYNDGYARPAALASAVDLSNSHLRIPVKFSSSASNSLHIDLTSAAGGTDFTNHLRFQILYGNLDSIATGVWRVVSMPLTEVSATTGTGANLSAVTGMRFVLRRGDTAYTVEVARVSAVPNAASKGKVILWLDDGSWTNHRDAIRIASRYGVRVTLAYVAENLTKSAAAIPADDARFVQNILGGQIAVHAFGPSDHNRVQDAGVLFEQLLDYQHFGMALGFHGIEDGAYWSSGFQGMSTQDRTLMAGKLFRSLRGGRSRLPETLPPAEPLNTRAMMVATSDTAAGTFIPYVQRAIAAKGLAQFVWHDMTSSILTEFEALCAWLDANRATVEVGTPQTVFDPLCI